jgi:hypothetical protein
MHLVSVERNLAILGMVSFTHVHVFQLCVRCRILRRATVDLDERDVRYVPDVHGEGIGAEVLRSRDTVRFHGARFRHLRRQQVLHCGFLSTESTSTA